MGIETNHCLSGERVLAPLDRAGSEQIRDEADRFSAIPGLRAIFDAVPNVLLVLNRFRQIVFANRSLSRMLGLAAPDDVYGRRPGEVLDCDHVDLCPGGCGTGETCATCGAARAIALCEQGAAAVQECRISQKTSGQAMDLRISTTPFQIDGDSFIVLSVSDISHEKRRKALERIFFHDVLNTASGITCYLQLLERAGASQIEDLRSIAARLTRTLVDEIQSHRELLAAENNDLQAHFETLNTKQLVLAAVDLYRHHEIAQERPLDIDGHTSDTTFVSDRGLVMRVLSNMVRNALEASTPGQTVRLGCRADDDAVEFWVHNTTAMPRDVQLQVFHRSFSTRGAGRGLGTYSIKLLTERYLGGSVCFSSSPKAGTTFHVRLPRSGPPRMADEQDK